MRHKLKLLSKCCVFKVCQYTITLMSCLYLYAKCKTVSLGINTVFLHGNSLREAVWSCKIHVQIMRFACCLNMAFTWKSLRKALICMHDVTLKSTAAVTDHFDDAFVRENVARLYMTLWQRNDVWKFDADAILFREIKCKKIDIWCLSDVFSAVYAKIR